MGSPSSQGFKVLVEGDQGSGKRSGTALWPDGEEIKNNHQQPRASPGTRPLQPLYFHSLPQCN